MRALIIHVIGITTTLIWLAGSASSAAASSYSCPAEDFLGSDNGYIKALLGDTPEANCPTHSLIFYGSYTTSYEGTFSDCSSQLYVDEDYKTSFAFGLPFIQHMRGNDPESSIYTQEFCETQTTSSSTISYDKSLPIGIGDTGGFNVIRTSTTDTVSGRRVTWPTVAFKPPAGNTTPFRLTTACSSDIFNDGCYRPPNGAVGCFAGSRCRFTVTARSDDGFSFPPTTLRFDVDTKAGGHVNDHVINRLELQGELFGTGDTTAPRVASISAVAPTTWPTYKPDVAGLGWLVTFSEDVENVDHNDFVVNGQSAATWQASGGIFQVSPGADASQYEVVLAHPLISTANENFNLAVASSNNIADLSGLSLSLTNTPSVDHSVVYVDGQAPTLIGISTDSGGSFTNSSTLTWDLTFSEPVTGLDSTDFSLGGLTALNIHATDVDGTNWQVTATLSGKGSGTATLQYSNSAEYFDLVGNSGNFSGATTPPSYTVDRAVPQISSIDTISELPAATLIWEIKFSEPVVNVDLSDFELWDPDNAGAALGSITKQDVLGTLWHLSTDASTDLTAATGRVVIGPSLTNWNVEDVLGNPVPIGSNPGAQTPMPNNNSYELTGAHRLTVLSNGSGSGTVVQRAWPQEIEVCAIEDGSLAASCDGFRRSSPSITLLPLPDTSTSSFEGWLGCDTVDGIECEVDFTYDRTVVAQFEKTSGINLEIVGGGSGSIHWAVDGLATTSSPVFLSGAYTSRHVTGIYPNATFNFVANADSGARFVGFDGCGTAFSEECSIETTPDSYNFVRAHFAQVRPVTVSKTGSGSVSFQKTGGYYNSTAACTFAPDCDVPSAEVGQRVTLSASPTAGEYFKGWSNCGMDDDAEETSCSFVVSQVVSSYSPSASFGTFSGLSVTRNSGLGSIIWSVTGGSSPKSGSCDFSAGCEIDALEAGQKISLSANSGDGHYFSSWSGACIGQNDTCQIDVTTDGQTITTGVSFAAGGTISVGLEGGGDGTVDISFDGVRATSCAATSGNFDGGSCSVTAPVGTLVTFTGNHETGSVFAGFSGDCTNTSDGSCEIASTAASVTYSITAHIEGAAPEQTADQVFEFVEQRASRVVTSLPSLQSRFHSRGIGIPASMNAAVRQSSKSFDFAGSTASLTDAAQERTWEVWFEGSAQSSLSETLDNTFMSASLGIDRRLADGSVLGVLVQSDVLSERSSLDSRTLDGNGWMAGPYFLSEIGDGVLFEALGMAGGSQNRISPFGTYVDHFETERRLLQLGLSGRHYFNDFSIDPEFKFLSYVEHQSAYIDGVGNPIPAQSVSMLSASLGPRLIWRTDHRDGATGVTTLVLSGAINQSRSTQGGVSTTTQNGSSRAELGYSHTLPDGGGRHTIGVFINDMGSERASLGVSASVAFQF